MLTDCGIVISALAVRIGAAAERNGRGGWCGYRSNTDVALTSIAGTAVGAVSIGLAANKDWR